MTLTNYLIVAGILFATSIVGILINRRSLITILLCLELLLLAVNINLVAFSSFLKDYQGQILVLFVLTVAAAEVAIGLAILIIYFRKFSNVEIKNTNTIKE